MSNAKAPPDLIVARGPAIPTFACRQAGWECEWLGSDHQVSLPQPSGANHRPDSRSAGRLFARPFVALRHETPDREDLASGDLQAVVCFSRPHDRLDSAGLNSRSAAARSSKGTFREAFLRVERARCPRAVFANRVWAVRKLARPATTPVCQELAARGADRLSATMKRGTGLSQGRKVLARAAVERRKASASLKKGTRAAMNAMDRRQRLSAGPRNLPLRLSALRPPLSGRPVREHL